jgi:hypothetical protein
MRTQLARAEIYEWGEVTFNDWNRPILPEFDRNQCRTPAKARTNMIEQEGRMRFRAFAGAATAIVIVAVVGGVVPSSEVCAQTSFAEDVFPIFKGRCIDCHQPGGDGFEKSGLDLSTYEGLMKGTKFGPMVIPRDPNTSNLMWDILRSSRVDADQCTGIRSVNLLAEKKLYLATGGTDARNQYYPQHHDRFLRSDRDDATHV